MNFTPELSALQGAILSADNVYQFSRLTARGGNEDAFTYVIESLRTFLEQGQYLVDGKVSRLAIHQVRKFALYIVLNADLPELQQLVELEEISALIWTTPTIPKCLMCELMWNLQFEIFTCEIISYGNPQLALEVAGAFLEHFKYLKPLDCLDQLQLLSSSCYILMCRMHLYNFESSELLNKSTAAFNHFQQYLKYYTTPPNNHNLNDLPKVELYKYQGQSLHSLLLLIDDCLTQFTSKLEVNPVNSEIYKLTFMEESIKNEDPTFNVCDSLNNVLLGCLNNANIAMLDTCKVLVMDVSVDVFCCWNEFEDNGKTMQQTVGELCFKVHSKLSTLALLVEHPLYNMLQQISRKPIEMKEKINATEDNVILQHIMDDNSEDSELWLKALVHKETLCYNAQLLGMVDANLFVYDADECYQLYTLLKQYSPLNLENKDMVDMLALKVFQKCELSRKYEILEKRFANKMFVDMEGTPQYSGDMTSVFNKLIATQGADLTDILTLFLQNPLQVLTKIFNLAAESAQQTQIMLGAMELLRKFSDHYYNTETECCMVQTAQKMFGNLNTDARENNYVQFLCGLKNADIISGTKLLMLIIMTNIHKALGDTDIGSLYVQLKLLMEAYTLEELLDYRAPTLAIIAQVLDKVRWQVNTFTANAPKTLNLAIEVQLTLMESFNGVIPDNNIQWLKNKTKNIQPLNMYYYRMLWDLPGNSYLEVVGNVTIVPRMSIQNLTSLMSQVLCSCTQQEWYEIWDSLKVFDKEMILNLFLTSVGLLTDAESSNRTENSRECILYCYRNLMYVTRYKFISEPVSDDQVLSVIRKAGKITELVTDGLIEELGTILLPLFAYLTEKQDDYNINLVDTLKKHLGHTKLAPMVNKVFRNRTP